MNTIEGQWIVIHYGKAPLYKVLIEEAILDKVFHSRPKPLGIVPGGKKTSPYLDQGLEEIYSLSRRYNTSILHNIPRTGILSLYKKDKSHERRPENKNDFSLQYFTLCAILFLGK